MRRSSPCEIQVAHEIYYLLLLNLLNARSCTMAKGIKIKILIKTVSISDQLFWSAITLGVFWSREQNGLNMRIVTAIKHAIPMYFMCLT